MKQTILKINELKKNYSLQSEETPVLKGITTDIYEKDFTIIMGNSGSGKSTFLYCVSGMDKATSGDIGFQSQRITSMNENQLAVLRRKNMGFIFQQMNLLPHLTLLENITAPAYLVTSKNRRNIMERAKKIMKDVKIEELKDRTPNQVSGGQLQRAAIARALINNPDIIFADEPTGALNSTSSKDVLDILTDCNEQGQSILMVTHDIKAALRGNRIIYIKDGNITSEKQLPFWKNETDYKQRERSVLDWLTEMGW
jgi:putative ABC transport system ATP-binding protein